MIDQSTYDLISNWATDKYVGGGTSAFAQTPSTNATTSTTSEPAGAGTGTGSAGGGMLDQAAATGMKATDDPAPLAATAAKAAAAPGNWWDQAATPSATQSAAAAPSSGPVDVNSWYRATLGRDGDQQGIAYWQNLIKNGMDPKAAYAEFTKGATANHEAVKNTDWAAANSYTGPQSSDASTPVDDWGRNVLGRDLTPAELATWNTKFNAAGASGGPAAVQKLYEEFLAANQGSAKNPNMSLAEASQISGGAKTPSAANGPALIDLNALAKRNVDATNETVRGQLGQVLAEDSPVLQQARAAAMTAANDRGLLNSTLATSGAQDAVIKSALQIAQPDAAAYGHAADYNAAATNQAMMWNAGAQNDFAKTMMQLDSDAQARGQQMTIAQMQDATSRYNAETNAATSKYNTDSNYKQQAENTKKTLVNNIIANMDLSPDRKAAMLEQLGEGTSAKRGADGAIIPGTGLAGAVYVIDSVAADLNFSDMTPQQQAQYAASQAVG